MDILDIPKKPRKVKEASFWQSMRNNLPKGWSATRLESRATQGVPDVLMQDNLGRWHLVELKTSKNITVDISPHQVAFATKHAIGSCWVAVKGTKQGYEGVYLYHGDAVMDLRLEGLNSTPTHFFSNPTAWEEFFRVLATHR